MTEAMDMVEEPTLRLDGKIAMVTGAGRGLGRACAAGLAKAGAKVIAVSRTASELDSLVADINEGGGEAAALVCDVMDPDEIKKKIQSQDRIDILLNNAGGNRPEPFVEISLENLDDILNLNVRAAFLVAQAVTRVMINTGKGGSIIHMSSQMGHVGAPNRTVYCTTKHGIEGLTKAMAVELAPYNIRVNSVAPTFVDTPMTKPFFENPEFSEYVFGNLAADKLASLQDIANAVIFLASPAASYITGDSLRVDGGWTAW
ncbi:MAG: glucose 1-dehydrogenase [Rhodospirillales bacterium]|nr:glucose 1-dehydrogenase [Rhodospirillales bacterium]